VARIIVNLPPETDPDPRVLNEERKQRTSLAELHTRIDKFLETPMDGLTEQEELRVRGEGTSDIRRSPYIPRPIDNTALTDYMACPRKFFYGMVLNRRRIGATPPALAFGTSWHAALEAHYKTGGDRYQVELAVMRSWQQHDRPDDHRTMQRVMTCYDQYMSHWGDHAADTSRNGRTVGFPENPMVEIPVEIAWPGGAHPYTGKIDRIIEINGLYYVEDHKTTSQLGAQYFQQYDPNNQMMGYAWLAQKLTGLRIAGVRINALGVLKTQTKLAREIVSYSKERLEEWGQNFNAWVLRLEHSYIAYQEAEKAEDGEPLLNSPLLLAAFPHNFMACSGKYGMCQYASVCSFQPARRGYVLETEFAEKEWDPMEIFSEGGASDD
jgi:hypothetical protein